MCTDNNGIYLCLWFPICCIQFFFRLMNPNRIGTTKNKTVMNERGSITAIQMPYISSGIGNSPNAVHSSTSTRMSSGHSSHAGASAVFSIMQSAHALIKHRIHSDKGGRAIELIIMMKFPSFILITACHKFHWQGFVFVFFADV